MMIDGDKLTAWLTEQEKAWADLVIGFLPEFEVERTPIDKISVPVDTRLRRCDPYTSFESAIKQTPMKSRILYRQIEAVMDTPMTDPQLLETLRKEMPLGNFTPSGVRTRRAELRDAGWIKDSGEKRDNHIVWQWVN